MKKIITSTVAALTLFTGASVSGCASAGPSEVMVQLFAKSQDMNAYEQELAVEVFRQAKLLAEVVKGPKEEVKAYIEQLVEQDTIDVDLVLANYKEWQSQVNEHFEKSLVAVAKLHAELDLEQREQLLETFKKLKAGKESFDNY